MTGSGGGGGVSSPGGGAGGGGGAGAFAFPGPVTASLGNYAMINMAREQQLTGMWMQRLNACQFSVNVWRDVLAIRKMVISPAEDVVMWHLFAKICRSNGQVPSLPPLCLPST